MPRGKLLLLTIPLLISGIFVVASPAPAPAATQIGSSGVWGSVSTGGSHTCAVTTGRSLYCWGDNSSGQIGDGTTTARPSPKRIASAGVWVSVSTGQSHTCAVTTGRSLYCWGDNSDGQIGDGTTTQRRSPKRIASAGVWSTASTGDEHTCAVTTGRSLYCWGDNSSGQIGDGTTTQRRSPKRIASAGVWSTGAAGGSHTCALTTGRSLYCWGDNSDGQIGDGTTTQRRSPKRIASAGVWSTASTGDEHTCAITTGRSLYCWGDNSDGQIGDGTTTQRRSPKKIGTSGVWTTVSTGHLHGCAVSTAKTLYCWGDNSYGQTSTSTATRYLTPKRVFSYADVRRTDARTRTSCAIRGTGTLVCWGNRVTSTPTPTPTPTPSPSPTPTPTPTLNPKAPGQILNLSYWKLTTPVNTSAVSGDPDEIKFGRTPDLATHFDTDYFFPNTAPAAGIAAYEGVYFRARTDGVTTSGSNYPRSELREMTGDSTTNAGWTSLDSTHTMVIRQAITAVPDVKPHVVAGQIHDGSDDVLQIRLEGKHLFAEVRNGDNVVAKETLTTDYRLGTMFTVSITAGPSGIRVVYNGAQKLNVARVGTSSSDWYFKAGVYTQAYAGQEYNNQDVPADTFGEVLIDSLSISPVT